jgi:branched-chain amino acid aminotransferase
MNDAKKIWLDGDLVDWSAAQVHVTSFGLHYGIGFFEGIRSYHTEDGPTIFRLRDHLRRLARSAATYLVPLPYDVPTLAAACAAVVVENGLTDCYLRPIVFLGDGESPLAAPYRVAVIATEHGPLIGPPKTGGVHAKVASFHRMSSNSIPPAAKATGQYLNSMLAQTEALASGYDEALLLNSAGYVTDGWAYNVFAVRDGVLLTPPVSAGALPGIVRDTVRVLAADAGILTHEENLTRTDLYGADECFLTGTAAGILPVLSVDRRPVADGTAGPLTKQLSAAYEDVTRGRSGGHPEWRFPVAVPAAT